MSLSLNQVPQVEQVMRVIMLEELSTKLQRQHPKEIKPSEIKDVFARSGLGDADRHTVQALFSVRGARTPGEIVADFANVLKKKVDVNVYNQVKHVIRAQDPKESVLAQFKLETYESPNGRGVRFLQPKGMSLLDMAETINIESQRLYGRNAIVPGLILKDEGMKTKPTGDVEHNFIPVVKGSNDKIRNVQREYLEENGMSFADRPLVTIATGLFRLRESFPKDKDDIGTRRDQGDLLKGQVVMAGSGALGSYVDGVDVLSFSAGGYSYDVGALDCIFAAASPNFKS